KECQDMPDWEYPFLESGVSTGYELVIDGNCQVIPNYMFGNSNFRSVTFNAPVKRIGQEALSRSSLITSITFPETLEEIGFQAMPQSTNLTSATFTGELKVIKNGVFGVCKKLETVHFVGKAPKLSDPFWEDTVTCEYPEEEYDSWNEWFTGDYRGADVTWKGYSDFDYTISSEGAKIIGYHGTQSHVTIPSSLHGLPVKEIGTDTFKDKNQITSITIPEFVEKIEAGSFSNMKGLEDVYFNAIYCQDGHYDTFAGSGSPYFDVYFGEEVTRIPGFVFGVNDSSKSNLMNIYPSSSIKEVGNYAFYKAEKLSSDKDLLKYVTKIGDGSFEGSGLDQIVVTENVTRIGENAFRNMNRLHWIYWNASNIQIGSNLFGNAGKDNNIELIIGKDVKTLPASLFNTGSDTSYLEKISGGEGLNKIYGYAFYNCVNLKYLTLKNSIEFIGESAFENCKNLQKVNILGNVDTINNNAFANCSQLQEVTFNGTMPTFGTDVFLNDTLKIFYPDKHSHSWHNALDRIYGQNEITWIAFTKTDRTGEDVQPITITSPNWPNPYPSNARELYSHRFDGATKIVVEFDPKSEVEFNYDSIILEGENTYLALDGTEMAGRSYTFYGEFIQILFESDNSNQTKGFSCKVTPYYKTESLVLTTPDWPEPYPQGTKFTKEFHFDGADAVDVTFDPESNIGIITNYDDTYREDYVALYDQKGNEIHKLGASQMAGKTFRVNGSYVKVVFDGKEGEGIGFKCNVQPIYYQQEETQLKGYSLSLSGNIGVNFYMKLSKLATYFSDTSYMEFVKPNNTVSKVYVKDAQIKSVDGSEYYVFPCFVSAKDMTGDIRATFIIDDQIIGNSYTYSVKEYANYLMNHEKLFDMDAINIASAMLSYGRNAQIYFNYKTDKLPTYVETYPAFEPMEDYKYRLVDKNADIDFVGARLILKDELGLKLYFNASDTADFMVDGKNVSATKEDGMRVITISNIKDPGLEFRIQSKDFELIYSVYSYGYQAFQTNKTDLKNLIDSIVTYYDCILRRNW
ncbi:MAG: leucine-rich repeat protein, partial [Firmicutes bacterium]|nr:leucine-rich repeat protein [Bacillota bacterium]